MLRELESLVAELSPDLADGDVEGDDAVERLLREVTRAYEARHAEAVKGEVRPGTLPADALDALIREISGPALTQYRLESGSRPGTFHTLDVDGPDVTCSCPGFEYRGNCSHAWQLKNALAKGWPAPAGFEPVA